MTVEPFLFSSRPDVLAAAVEAGAEAVVVDWERKGKADRQASAAARIGTDTQIGSDTTADLARTVRTCGPAGPSVICRINAVGAQTAQEIASAADLGATEVLVPMVRSVEQVEQVLQLAAGRVAVGVMIETVEAVAQTRRLAALPLVRAYVGLMDLALDRRTPSIFTALVDGTVERVRDAWAGPFGFAGLTVPGGGDPIATDLLLAEMDRLDAGFTFLRRSFLADTCGGRVAEGIRRIRVAAREATGRSAEARGADRLELVQRVRALDQARRSA